MDVIARLRERHQPQGYEPDYCRCCGGAWPCDTVRVLDVCEAAREHRQAYDAARGTSRQDFARVYETALSLDAALARLEATDA